jgi:hypothetical protein
MGELIRAEIIECEFGFNKRRTQTGEKRVGGAGDACEKIPDGFSGRAV